MQSVEELAHYFVYHITQSRVGVEARIKSALASIPTLLGKGWSLYEIKMELDQFAQDYPQVVPNIYHIGEIMDKKEPPNNLLEPDVFYYHSELRNMSQPPRITKDPETGRMVRHSEPFYLEMKQRYSMQELMDYWYKQQEITPNEHMLRQDEGKFKYILGNYTLDEVLFSIDVSNILRKERQLRPLRNAFELDKYIEDAREAIQRKQNVHKMQGINREFRRDTVTAYH
jgi:hypothetical protein